MKRALKILFFISLGIVMAMTLTEIIARAIFPDYADSGVYLNYAFARLLNSRVKFGADKGNFDRKYGFVLSPNSESVHASKEFTYTMRTNSLGFRTKEIQPKNGNEYRVMLIGDSMLWGVGVEERDTVASCLERLGEAIPAKRLSSYNYSVKGYNTVQELIVAKNHMGPLQPDHIILGFLIANDIIPNAIAFIDDQGNYNTSAAVEARFREELRKDLGILFNSVIYRIIALHVFVPKIRYRIATRDDVIAKSYELLTEFNDLAENNGIRFSVVIFYPKDSVQGGIVEKWSNSREAGRLIGSFCRLNSIEALDLLEYMNTPDGKNRYFFAADGHPNKEGNQVVAEAIFNDLVKRHLLR